LIESIPRSASMSICKFSISGGYPVFSPTIAVNTPTMSIPANPPPEAAPDGVGTEAPVEVAVAGVAAGIPAERYWIICSSVLKRPRSPGCTTGALGTRSWKAERISTRLIESMPRSASISICRFSISGGYPVFSPTIAVKHPDDIDSAKNRHQRPLLERQKTPMKGGRRSRLQRACPRQDNDDLLKSLEATEISGLYYRCIGNALLKRG